MKVDLDPLEDLTTIGPLARAPTAMVVPAELPVTTVQEFVDAQTDLVEDFIAVIEEEKAILAEFLENVDLQG